LREFVKKRSFISNSSIFECFASKDLLKKDDVEQKMLLENFTFNYEKSLAFAICAKCVVKLFSVTIMSLCSIPFSKIIFKQNFAWIAGENQRNICFAFAKWL